MIIFDGYINLLRWCRCSCFDRSLKNLYADVAQLVEHDIGNIEVSGSIPDIGSSFVEKDTEAPRKWDARSASHQKVGLLSETRILVF